MLIRDIHILPRHNNTEGELLLIGTPNKDKLTLHKNWNLYHTADPTKLLPLPIDYLSPTNELSIIWLSFLPPNHMNYKSDDTAIVLKPHDITSLCDTLYPLKLHKISGFSWTPAAEFIYFVAKAAISGKVYHLPIDNIMKDIVNFRLQRASKSLEIQNKVTTCLQNLYN